MALVELALIIIVLVLLTFGAMEYGWLFFRLQQLTNAAWTGARTAILPDATNAGVESTVDALMAAWDMYGHTTTISVGDVTLVEPGAIVQVTVSVPTANVQLMGLSILPRPTTLRASASMAKEGP
ncbi:MAG: pilus assembly protein [Candidatus Hydrogenedentes bacterium]|nr:pilus assembly protein [Candidatus Hydrogenedentota bacterium]